MEIMHEPVTPLNGIGQVALRIEGSLLAWHGFMNPELMLLLTALEIKEALPETMPESLTFIPAPLSSSYLFDLQAC